MESGPAFTFGDKMWVDVHTLSYFTKSVGSINLKTGKSLHKISFPFLAPVKPILVAIVVYLGDKANTHRLILVYYLILLS